ncbi:MAG: hypothetical protein DCC55_04285 [Chloroflexi bacterium]|nr:MAG: hypothetical protein DCC55_04285 [Chloroflexota bacterium]
MKVMFSVIRTPLLCIGLVLATTLLGGAHVAVAAPVAQGANILPLVLNGNCLGGKPYTPFAVQLYSGSGLASGKLPALNSSGATWVRNQVFWELVEPTNRTPPQYNWVVVDRTVGAVTQGCFHMILTHVSSPTWAATNAPGLIDKVGFDRFAQYIGALVERYDGDGIADAPGSPIVEYFEFYNEPDAGPRPHGEAWGNYGAEYAEMLKTVYPVIKAANPNAQVVFGGIAYDGFTENGGIFVRSFLDDALAAGAGDYFDIMNFHQYPAFAAAWTNNKGPGLLEKTEAIRQKLAEYGLDKPIIITETGWHNNAHPLEEFSSNDEIQSRYVVSLFAQGLAADVKINTWWPFIDIGPTYEYDSGLITVDGQLKPAYGVFQLMTQELGSAQYVRTLTQAQTGNADLEVHEFTDTATGQTLYVAWRNPVDNPSLPGLPLALNAAQVLVKDLYGATSVVNDADDGSANGRVTVSVGRPVYIRVLQ